MQDEIDAVVTTALDQLKDVQLDALDDWRRSYLGRGGRLNALLRSIGSLPAAERPRAGQAANAARKKLGTALKQREAALSAEGEGDVEQIDVTIPGYRTNVGGLHPITRTLRDIARAFAPLGFRVVDTPEVEWDEYNFEKLNIPPDHPARDMWDTFFVKNEARPGAMLLRTHTSPAQIRVMEQIRPPVRVLAMGRCYRYEDVDATHESIFYQIEGLAIDSGITMSDLRGVLEYFARTMFGRDRKIRIRGSFFPFTEPSCEAEMSCHVCGGEGCRVCSGTGWIEILGAGMVHPDVLRGVGYDPDRYSGFAFGMGAERIAMLRYGIDDIRNFYRNDLRFLRQFN
ncbi:MAG: phenylalanine--tRNA ligase subunit alpha [Chloroflexi bacterium]|nr:phenylalanine--tRNA ligase subunit alpha [Chloroflexota bacterium]MCY3937428.1 phenylalanine--tRNA ligase subunit alpha [Chloroflexota bacterium]